MRQMSFTWMAVAASWPVLPIARVLGRLLQACHLDVGRNHLLKVVADRDFARLATFFLEGSIHWSPASWKFPQGSLARAPAPEEREQV